MLKRTHNQTCECCSSIHKQTVYQWMSFRYCLTCLHSIGRNAAGNYSTPKQYRDAWLRLAA